MGNQFTRFQCWDTLQSNLRILSRSWLSTAMLLQTSPPMWTPAYLLQDNQLASSTVMQSICWSLLKLQPTFPSTFFKKYLFKSTMFTQTQPYFGFQGKSHRLKISLNLFHVVFLKFSLECRALLLAERAHLRRAYNQMMMEVLLFWEEGCKNHWLLQKKNKLRFSPSFIFLKDI